MTQPIKLGLKTGEVLARLRDRYKAPEYAFFTEICRGTGYNRGERADGLAIGLWPSRGMYVTGFEIKVSRSDWLAEKRNPKKAETIAAYCDFWFLVVGDMSVITRLDEVPENWGVMAPHGRGLTVVKEPVKLESRPLDKDFVVALARDVHRRSAGRAEIEAAVDKARQESYERGKKDGERSGAWRLPHVEEDLKRLKETVAKFEQASGISLSNWEARDPETLGRAVKMVLNREVNNHQIQAAKSMAIELLEGVLAYERVSVIHGLGPKESK